MATPQPRYVPLKVDTRLPGRCIRGIDGVQLRQNSKNAGFHNNYFYDNILWVSPMKQYELQTSMLPRMRSDMLFTAITLFIMGLLPGLIVIILIYCTDCYPRWAAKNALLNYAAGPVVWVGRDHVHFGFGYVSVPIEQVDSVSWNSTANQHEFKDAAGNLIGTAQYLENANHVMAVIRCVQSLRPTRAENGEIDIDRLLAVINNPPPADATSQDTVVMIERPEQSAPPKRAHADANAPAPAAPQQPASYGAATPAPAPAGVYSSPEPSATANQVEMTPV